MSRASVVAKRYAKALFQAANDKGLVAETESQLKLIVDVVAGNADLRAFLVAPNITLDTKKKTLFQAFGADVSPIVLNAVGLLIERGREGELAGVLDAYLQVAGEALGRADAHVTSPAPLSEQEKSNLAEKFGALLGKTIRVTNSVNPELLGGLTVRIGDTLYDGSLKGKLERLDKTLQTAAI
ncbi:F0F1 ATP synthase subunit delta [Cohnella sp. LGH]|uniref:ATP synthase subunit delta n=1 Tax=Cohnella phaseoli TaxID=456490 RepID=A0A3D9KC25_9BACL|nr:MULTISPECIES: F0F1 ATP synthase subunit delta [Cohnella]QTH42375.1 F0F1 ATP synthase subunit delta [Cohnella sp. LGH]RED84084.1 F-type H+-transporting ATPase subunit delta [Cohnella phaseoli]